MRRAFLAIGLLLIIMGCIDDQQTPNIVIDDSNYNVYGGDINDFTDLNDTPNSYSGASLKCIRVNSGETGLEFTICASGGGAGTTYTGILPIYIDNDANTISLDINSLSNWIGLFDGYDSNAFILWTDGNQTFYTQIDLNNLLGANINNLYYGSGAPHFGNTTTNGLAVNGNAGFYGNVITGTSEFLMNLIPDSDNQQYIGSISNRWKAAYIIDINATDINAERFCLNGDCITDWNEIGGLTLGDLYAIFPTNPIGDENVSDNITVNWTGLQNYPTSCTAGDFVTAVGDTLTCNTPNYTIDTNYDNQDFNNTMDNRYVNEDQLPLGDSDIQDDITLTNITQIQNRAFDNITNRLFSLISMDDNSNLDARYVNESNYIVDDNNALKDDLNANGKSIIKVHDINAEAAYIETGDMNFYVFDMNVIIQTANGAIWGYPDENKFCVGKDPAIRACMWIDDLNAVFGFG